MDPLDKFSFWGKSIKYPDDMVKEKKEGENMYFLSGNIIFSEENTVFRMAIYSPYIIFHFH
jgi:hypothetical protein